MKKVLFVATVVKTHIMQFHLSYLQMFQQMGWETHVAAKNDYEDPADCVIPYCDRYINVPFHRLPWKKDNISCYHQLKKLIDEEHYDIIHCHTPVGAMIARMAAMDARKKGTKVIYTAHGFHFFKGAPLQNWLFYFPPEWLLSFWTDVLITINREDYDRAAKLLHPKRLEYVRGVGVDTGKFRQEFTDPAEKRRSLGFDEKDLLMLTVAEMTANKNHATILRAMAEMKDTEVYEKLHYLVVGRGEQWEALEQLGQDLGISDHVHFLGYRLDARDFYHCCDLFAFMPFREGLSVALMEAMASGMPIFCTKIRGNTDLIEDEVSGIFLDNQPKAVAQGIVRLCRDEALRERLGTAAAEKVQLFDSQPVQEQVKQIYLSL